jgi:transcription elongation factor GreA
MSKVSYITEEGLKNLQIELDHLLGVERPEISRQIGEAIDKGDLSENAEYDAAKEAQGLLEAKISQLRTLLSNARVIDESKIDASKVQILTTVKIKNVKNNAVMTYALVPESEADFKKGKLSVNTPIAKGLMGKKIGDVVDITVPNGVIPFEIIDITI